MVFTAAPVEPTQAAPERQPEKVSYQPQPQSKKEPVSRLANELIQLSGFAAQLMLQSHLVHLNFEGQLDRFGELTRSLDFLMPMCSKGLLGSCKKFQHIKAYEGAAMLITYYENLECFGMCAKDVAKLASKMDAFDIENYCGEVVEDCFTAAWQIKATLRCD
jgi:hypothetical protein